MNEASQIIHSALHYHVLLVISKHAMICSTTNCKSHLTFISITEFLSLLLCISFLFRRSSITFAVEAIQRCLCGLLTCTNNKALCTQTCTHFPCKQRVLNTLSVSKRMDLDICHIISKQLS